VTLDEKGSDQPPRAKDTPAFGKGMLALIICIAAIIIIFLVATTTGTASGQNTAVPPAVCMENSAGYINQNLVQPGTSVTLASVSESHGMYEMKGSYQGQAVTLYATKDCTLLFTSAFDMAGSSGGAATARTPTPTPEPVRTSRPVADLYVMSFCPYGTIAETAMEPVAELLGDKADIRIRYITTVSGETAGDISSLHGPAEVNENLLQVCVMKSSPGKYWQYLTAFNEQCYPLWQDGAKLAECRNTIASTLGIDTAALESCASGTEAIAVLKADEADVNRYGAYASPTLLINGVEYRGARTPEAYKQAVCNSFDTPPEECSTVLSSGSSAGTAGAC
jgi:hypothetical protein